MYVGTSIVQTRPQRPTNFQVISLLLQWKKKSAPAYLGLQGWLISESSQSIHLTLPQNCQKGNFSSSERGELTIKTDPYKNSHLKSIFFFPLFLSQKPPVKVFLIKMTRRDHTLFDSELILFRREVGIIIFLNEQ